MKSDNALINNRIFINEMKNKIVFGMNLNSKKTSINDSMCSVRSGSGLGLGNNTYVHKEKTEQSMSVCSVDIDQEIDLSHKKISPEIKLESNNFNQGLSNINEERIDKTKLKLNLSLDNSKKEKLEA